MAYLQNLRKKITENSEALPAPEVQILGRERCVIAGHKGLYSLSEEEVVVRRRNDRVLVRGRRLRVQEADQTEICICGEVHSLEFIAE